MTDAIGFEALDPSINRLWIRVSAEPDEHVWGGGEQMSYFDLRGRRFPFWTSEPGVGRDQTTEITFKANVRARQVATTATPTTRSRPMSLRRYALHVETPAYSVFDFRRKAFHEIEVWAIPERIELLARPTFIELVEMLSKRFGRQPPLPEWVYNGAIVGLKDGANSFARLEDPSAGVEVSASGARTGSVSARHRSVRASSGIGRQTRPAILV